MQDYFGLRWFMSVDAKIYAKVMQVYAGFTYGLGTVYARFTCS